VTTIEALEQEGLIRRLPPDPRRVGEALVLADRDLAVLLAAGSTGTGS